MKIKNNDNPLNIAVRNKNYEVIKMLLLHPKIDENNRSYLEDMIEETALHIAIKNNDIESCKLLMEIPNIDVNSKLTICKKDTINEEETPLNIAVKNENIEIVKLLLADPKTDVNLKSIKNDEKKTALSIAIKKNNIEIVKHLLDNPKTNVNLKSKLVNEYSYMQKETAFEIAVKNNNTEIIKLLLNNPNVDINHYEKSYDFETPLNIAIKNKNYEMISYLLNRSENIVNCISRLNKLDETALNVAINNQNQEIIDILLSQPKINLIHEPKRIKLDFTEFVKRYETPFHIFNTNTDAKGYISLEAKSYENFVETVLCSAVKNNNIQLVKKLLTYPNLDVNAKSIYNEHKINIVEKTALSIAIESENVEIIRLLLSIPNIDVNSSLKNYQIRGKYDFEETEKCPIHIAVEKGNLEIINLLISNPNININAKMYHFNGIYHFKSFSEETVLHIAVDNENIDIVRLLINIPELNVNAKARYGSELIFFERELDRSKQEEVGLFIEKEPKDVYEFRQMKKTLSIAQEKENLEIIEILSSRKDIDMDHSIKCLFQKTYFSTKDRIGYLYYSSNDTEEYNEAQLDALTADL